MDGNLAMVNVLEQDEKQVNQMLEAAYLAGFEPSSDNLPAHEEIEEATEFLTNKEIRS